MDADWRIVPRQGLGRLTFGLSVEEAGALASVYGKPGPLVSQAHVIDDMEKIIAMPGSTLSPEDIAVLRQKAGELRNYAIQVLTGAGPVSLDYVEGRLVAVMIEPKSGPAHFEGQAVFGLKPREVLALFERANGAPGRYSSTEAAFDNLAVSLHAFSLTSREKVARVLAETEELFAERSITLRREPYRPADEMHRFVTVSVL